MMSVWARFGAVVCVIAAPLLAACGSDVEDNFPAPQERHPTSSGGYSGPNEGQESIFGPGGLFGSSKDKNQDSGGGIGVNAYLWRATLDTVSFMPLTSADPFGGVIITDWYQPPESPNERLKLTIVILDRQLRADGIRVSVFRQTRGTDGAWVDAKVDPKTAQQMEDAILARARELRIANNGKS